MKVFSHLRAALVSLFSILVLTLTFAVVTKADCGSNNNPLTITGRVVNANGQSVAGIKVIASNRDTNAPPRSSDFIYTAYTNSSGIYTFSIPNSTAGVNCDLYGVAPESFYSYNKGYDGFAYDSSPNSQTINFLRQSGVDGVVLNDFEMILCGQGAVTSRGVIKDSNGKALQGVTVVATDSQTGTVYRSAITHANGSYEFSSTYSNKLPDCTFFKVFPYVAPTIYSYVDPAYRIVYSSDNLDGFSTIHWAYPVSSNQTALDFTAFF